MGRVRSASSPVRVKHPQFVLFLVLLVLTVGALALIIDTGRAILLGFDFAAVVFVAATFLTMHRASPEHLRTAAAINDAGRLLLLLISAIVLLVILIVVGVEAWSFWLYVALAGILVLIAGAAAQIGQLVVSIRRRDLLRDRSDDPWDGRSLEWATASPPPEYNFAVPPDVTGEEAYWHIKRRAIEEHHLGPEPRYAAIRVPRNSPIGIVVGFFAFFLGFAMIWHIWWLAMAAGFVILATIVGGGRDEDDHRLVAIDELAEAHRRLRKTHRQLWLSRQEQAG